MRGAQSILIDNIENKQHYFSNRLIQLGDNYMINKKFMIGEPIDRDEVLFVKSFYELLCIKNCELIDFINKKIQGKLEECDIKEIKKPKISDLLKIYQQQVESCSVTDIVGECCDWESVEW